MKTLGQLALTLITITASIVVIAFLSDVTGISLMGTGNYAIADTTYFKPITFISFATLFVIYLYGHVHLKNKERS